MSFTPQATVNTRSLEVDVTEPGAYTSGVTATQVESPSSVTTRYGRGCDKRTTTPRLPDATDGAGEGDPDALDAPDGVAVSLARRARALSLALPLAVTRAGRVNDEVTDNVLEADAELERELETELDGEREKELE